MEIVNFFHDIPLSSVLSCHRCYDALSNLLSAASVSIAHAHTIHVKVETITVILYDNKRIESY